MSVNKAIVIGNLGANPDIRALPSGQNVAADQPLNSERKRLLKRSHVAKSPASA